MLREPELSTIAAEQHIGSAEISADHVFRSLVSKELIGRRNILTGRVATKQGLATIRAKVVVDCTGDADVAYFARAETLMETVEPRMPNTMLLNFANVTAEQARASNRREIAKRAKGKFPLIPPSWMMGPVSNGHHYFSNHTKESQT